MGLLAGFWKSIVAALLAAKKLVIAALAGGAAFVKRLLGRKAPRADEPSA